jgi:hypothetical protein
MMWVAMIYLVSVAILLDLVDRAPLEGRVLKDAQQV